MNSPENDDHGKYSSADSLAKRVFSFPSAAICNSARILWLLPD